MEQPYKHPPVTEAAIELRFDRTFSRDVVEKAARRLETEYLFSDQDSGVDFQIDATGRAKITSQWQGVRLSSPDRTDITIFRTNTFVCVRLAPYTGWKSFLERVERDWAIWKRAAGSVRLVRVGVRYINRIDIPVSPTEPTNIDDYLNLAPKLPEIGLPPISGFAMQVVQPVGADECVAALNSASVDSPLLNHASFLLDLDLFRDKDVPQRDDELWAFVERMREHKNQIFEGCITDRARELFNQ